METIEMLINELNSEILKAKKAPFSAAEIVMNRGDMLDIVAQLRANYPIVVKEAMQIKRDRDDILAKAEKYANDTMDKAEMQAKVLISETEIVRAAAIDAENMRIEAEENYRKMDYESRSLAFNILDSAEKTIKDGLIKIADRKRKLIDE